MTRLVQEHIGVPLGVFFESQTDSQSHRRAAATAPPTGKLILYVILQIFGVVLFSVFSVVNGFTEIQKTPKCEKYIE